MAATKSSSSENLIFISYAWEDGELALWLANTLLRHGFHVWLDRKRLLGGEPFPKEIEDAIGKKTFRFLALMSKASLNKESPRRERMLASKAAKKKGVKDFIIPVRADDLSPDEFDFITTELTALDFTGNWAEGFRALMKKLESLELTPDSDSGFKELQRFIETGDEIKAESETGISNLLEIKEIPSTLCGYRRTDVPGEWMLENRKRYYETDFHIWTFCSRIQYGDRTIEPFYTTLWRNVWQAFDIKPRDVVVYLVESYLSGLCIEKGLLEEDKVLYFPVGLLPKDKIHYPNQEKKLRRSPFSGPPRMLFQV